MAHESSPSTRTIVILGGSYSGISTAHYLLRHALPTLPHPDMYRVVLVNPSRDTMCRSACPRAMISDAMFDQSKLFVDIPRQFEQYPDRSFQFLQGRATALDHYVRAVTIRAVEGTSETLEYHALVIATGASTPSPLLGPNPDTPHLKQNWAEFRKALPTARSIVIAGGGPAGVETAGELGEYLNGRTGWFNSKMDHPKVAITIVTAGSQILPVLRPSLATKAEKFLAQVGVKVVKNARVVSVTPAGSGTKTLIQPTTVLLDNSTTLEANIYIPATGTNPNTSFIDPTLLTSDGRVETNKSTLRVDKAGPRVYALGDAASAARPAVHLIFEEVPVLCTNIKKDLLMAAGAEKMTLGEDRAFGEDMSETQMVPIGKSKGVGAAMGWALPSWLIWAIKGRDYWLWTTGPLWSGKQWTKEK
ncbi:uncharacterized protein HMPREF1541_10715 [Cyphellophora europaea CBS 101466]|uniref:FAD/NAD(P)-binding domain-containing protein n=1 Tax=Cyphellophora europaea (strain CBS 101466) TaxID=1220924 RepID=W2S6B2_CYPE1|nr:uncharacterized protein HMPREF1541_10715 [Cyphellophora europaea CBS 101466]ETN44165.1 hypothetical protein HMPREF1541_10715 [Cyphellophora europaea CBS 101466]